MNCPTPWKMKYRDDIAAKIALARLTHKDRDDHRECRIYECPSKNHWHLTSKR